MTKRRSRGDGGLHWDEARQRWIATVTVGYDGAGKRTIRRASGKTKSEALAKLKEILRNSDDGMLPTKTDDTVGAAVNYWLDYGLSGRSPKTVAMYRTYAQTHIIPALGKRKLRDLTVEDVERFLAKKSAILSTRSLKIIHGILSRSVRHAQARDKIRRNVVALCDIPEGRPGRVSKSLTLDQAEAVLTVAEGTRLHAYIVLSLLTGARTEEIRAVTWRDIDLVGEPDAATPIPAFMAVWRSVRVGGDTKTRMSRRSLALPQRCIDALTALWEKRTCDHATTAQCSCLVFATRSGTPLTAHNVRRDFRKVITAAGLTGHDWSPRELRHSFVSLLSDAGVPLENIPRRRGPRAPRRAESIVTQLVTHPAFRG